MASKGNSISTTSRAAQVFNTLLEAYQDRHLLRIDKGRRTHKYVLSVKVNEL